MFQTPTLQTKARKREILIKVFARYAHFALTQDVEGFMLLVTSELGWTKEQSLVYAAQVRRELRSGKHHVYYRQRIVWARKPEGNGD